MSADNKEVFIDQAAVERVDARIRESKAMTQGLMSSWSNPMEGVTEGPMGKVTAPKQIPVYPKESAGGVAAQIMPKDEKVLIVIPLQAMKLFKSLLGQWFELEVRLTPDQAKMLLESLQAMPTPKKMFDAEAVFNLMNSLRGR